MGTLGGMMIPIVEEEAVTAPMPPAEANTWFMAVTDQRDAMVTTTIQFQK
jgi:hypothetical protein